MAQLAIKGHATRGKEVIKILEMLGGKNIHYSWGVFKNRIYTIDEKTDEIIDVDERYYSNYNVFTLEEFLEKYPYKVGDKVIIKGYKQVFKIRSMRWCSERNDVLHLAYNGWFYTEELQPYKEETMENKPNLLQRLKEYFDNTPRDVLEKEWNELSYLNEIGPTIDQYLECVKKYRLPKYPKTFVECCEILYPNENFQTVSQPIKGHNGKKLFVLQKLLICRNAYWKIAGEQMGLGKPWEPYWTIYEHKFCLGTDKDKVIEECVTTGNRILAFPTKEMRDAFKENFDGDIDACKEFL